jgi:hypothetical protein
MSKDNSTVYDNGLDELVRIFCGDDAELKEIAMLLLTGFTHHAEATDALCKQSMERGRKIDRDELLCALREINSEPATTH